MKKILALLLSALLLTGCAAVPAQTTAPTEITQPAEPQLSGEMVYITLLGNDASVKGDGVSFSRDIVYYEAKDEYESGNPYGEGESWEMHSAEEAAEHLVVRITQPGTYHIGGALEKGQILVDLGEDAREDPNAVVNLILDGADITCTVGPAILFLNVYECDGSWSADTATADVDTTAAGANLILAEGSSNVVNGSHVAKIYKDTDGEKKLWKQDGAIYSYMSMNVYGPGRLDLYADNEGLDTELHLSIWGGDINIRSANDGINTNEDGVSVTAIHGGNVHIIAGLGEEGDGIDSNGYLVIRGGTVVASANPAADAGLDSDLGSFIHGGTVIALGSTMDWAESDSGQVTMNLQFAMHQNAGSSIVIAREDGSVVFAYDPGRDTVLGDSVRSYQGAVISCPDFAVGDSYEVFLNARIFGEEKDGIYDISTVTGFENGVKMSYTGTDVMLRPGGNGDFGGGQRPEIGITPPDQMPDPPEADFTIPPQPEGGIPMEPMGDRQPPEGGERPEDWTRPDADWTMPEGPGWSDREQGEPKTLFYMLDQVNFFSGVTEAK